LERLRRIWAKRSWLWLYWALLAATILTGVLFRSNRYWFDPISLWGDEALWGKRLFTHALTELYIRPIGFMALSKALVKIYSDERVLRLLPYLSGLATLGVALYVASRLFRSRMTRFLFVFVLAFHPVLIDMSREFKPYSVEVLAHLGILALYLRWEETDRRLWLYALVAACVVAFPLAYNVAFLLPVVFILIALRVLQRRAFRALLVVAGAVAMGVAIMLAVYWKSVSRLNTDSAEEMWSKKYDAFYLEHRHLSGKSPKSYLQWLTEKHVELAAFVGEQRNYWRPGPLGARTMVELKSVDRNGWLLLHIAGVCALVVGRQYRRLALLFAPLWVLVLFNALGYWPLEAFRVNTFLLVYYVTIAAFGMDAIANVQGRARWLGFASLALFVVLPNLTVGYSSHRRKYAETFNAEFMTLFRYMRAQQPRELTGRTRVLGDWYSCRAFQFYPDYHDGMKREFGNWWNEHFVFDCTGTVSRTESKMRGLHGETYWLIATDDRVKRKLAEAAEANAAILSRTTLRKTHDVYLLRGN